MPLIKSILSIRIWIKNIDNILFIFKDFEFVLYIRFNYWIRDINDKKDIINPSIKLNWLRIFKWKFNIDTKNIKELIININPPNIFNVNFDPFDFFLNDS